MLQRRGAGRATLPALIAVAALGIGAGSASAAKDPPATGPTASYTFAPAKPLVGAPIAFASTATPGSSAILGQAWDFDDDGHADAFGAAATHTYTAPGVYPVTLFVLARDGRFDSETQQVEVFQPPTAAFTFAPAKPGAGRPVTLTSMSTAAPGLTLATQKWDLDGDGQYDDATGDTATTTFSHPGTYAVGLQVADSKGITATTTQDLVVYAPPIAGFHLAPTAPVPNQQMTFSSFSSDSDGTIVSQLWDVDGDGFDDGSGATLTKSFPAGHYRARLRVTDSQGLVTTTSKSFDVVPAPTVDFSTAPQSPVVGTPITFTSQAAAASGYTLTSQKWDLDGDGQYDDATGATATKAFTTPGDHTVGLEVTDSRGITSATSKSVTVGAPPVVQTPDKAVSFDTTSVLPPTPQGGILDWLTPFPVVRIAGVAHKSSTRIRVFSVLTPLGATVSAHCSSRKCSRRPLRTESLGAAPATLLRLHEFERTLPKGTRLTVSIRRVGFVGKYTRFQLRARKAPKRTDRCYVPGNDQPVKCPRQP